nr:SusC/RagA family TonB-linked outer membrane protein [Parabacteroides sp.]
MLPQLKLKADFSYRPSSYDVKDVEPEFRYIQDSWESMDIAVNTETGRISKIKEDVQLFTTNVYADYNQTFGKHTLGGLVGFNQEVWKKEQLSAGNTGIMSIGAPTLGNTYGVNPSKGEVDEHWAVRGVFMRINYNYSDRYLFEMNGRYDGSSKFPHDSRFKFFPSFSAAWRLSEESFMADTRSWLDNLKIRASYGSIGNQNVANYGFYSRMGSSQSSAMINGQRPYQVNPPGLISPDFTWETATTINGGLDVSLLSNRLNYSFDIYRRETKDIIMDGSTYPSVLGTSAPMVNSGKLRTHGWEMSLGWKDRLSNGFFYDLNFVLSDYQTEVALFNGNDNCSLGSLYTGKKVGEIWGYVTDRILQEGDIANNLIIQYTDENGNNLHRPNESNSAYYPGDIMYKDINGDGKVDRGLNTLDDHGDLKVLGNNTPRLKFGLTGNFAWKGFDLNLFFQGVGKRDVWISDKTYWGDEDGPGSKKVYENSWTPEQTDAKYPLYGARRSQNWYTQSAYMFNGAYLRLKQAILGYTVPAEITNKIKMSKLRVYVSGFNLFEITELPDVYDPDLLSTSYPQMRSIALGVQVGF